MQTLYRRWKGRKDFKKGDKPSQFHFASSKHLYNTWQYLSPLNIQSLVTDIKLPLLSERPPGKNIDEYNRSELFICLTLVSLLR